MSAPSINFYWLNTPCLVATASFTGLPLVVCGMLKIIYDLLLLYSFRHTKLPEERVSGQFSR
jgi:hypothetical protein